MSDDMDLNEPVTKMPSDVVTAPQIPAQERTAN